jgi:TolA-binding protein
MKTALLSLSLATLAASGWCQQAPTQAPSVAVSSPAPVIAAPADRTSSEWDYLKATTASSDRKLSKAAIDRLDDVIQLHPESDKVDEALAALAAAQHAHGEYKAEAILLLRLISERPSSKYALAAKSDLLDLADHKLSSYHDGLHRLAAGSDSADKAERLALCLEGSVENLGGDFYEPLARELRRFSVRFPDYKKRDELLWRLAQLEEKDGRWASALVVFEELQAGFPEGPFASQAEFDAGRIYQDRLRDYKRAIGIFEDLAAKYPNSSLLLSAMERTSELLSDRLGQYELAVKTDEKIIAQFPKSPGALKAYKHEANLRRDRLDDPRGAIETEKRLADQFGGTAAIEALETAAKIARKDLKDYKLEIELRNKIAADIPDDAGAPEQLFEIGRVYEDDLNDIPDAIKSYQGAAAKFPDSRYGKKAADRAAALQSPKR